VRARTSNAIGSLTKSAMVETSGDFYDGGTSFVAARIVTTSVPMTALVDVAEDVHCGERAQLLAWTPDATIQAGV
jgi:hypothetical protein